MILRLVAALLLLAVLGLGAWVRLAPLPADLYHRMDSAHGVGDWPAPGGFEAVRQVTEPKATLAALVTVVEATPRTALIEGSVEEGLVTVVTRSALWGLPDISNLWIEGDRVHVRGHLIFGPFDFGGNRSRIEGWLARAGVH
ncbi:DUF1499 domain-containing protein [Paenirhodobacter hankyongi]|uniref:DUF1499 domain-containing protein n=1 Tax=Paenirhodobacter hankyongi TaxID=2294033 RepID=A0A421BMD2_9RHOB|nr:DUF1499 domain-containing protein [Sinirhodobacter hankyongi]RLL63935.1 DUF1499 domain-containing protein [Sinirhodobacter hankyongi]